MSSSSSISIGLETIRDTKRLSAALRMVLRRYAAQLRARPGMTCGALLLPAVGDVLTLYVPPLLIAKLLGVFARGETITPAALAPYVLAFAGVWLAGQIFWRIAVALIARVEIRSMEALYIEALDEIGRAHVLTPVTVRNLV